MISIKFLFFFIPLLSVILILVNLLLAPHVPYKEKKTPFECGYHSFLLQNRTQFTISFFVFAILFLLFDLEIVLIYPLSVSIEHNGVYGLVFAIIFIAILTVGFVFELGKGALRIESRQNAPDPHRNMQLLQARSVNNPFDSTNYTELNNIYTTIDSISKTIGPTRPSDNTDNPTDIAPDAVATPTPDAVATPTPDAVATATREHITEDDSCVEDTYSSNMTSIEDTKEVHDEYSLDSEGVNDSQLDTINSTSNSLIDTTNNTSNSLIDTISDTINSLIDTINNIGYLSVDAITNFISLLTNNLAIIVQNPETYNIILNACTNYHLLLTPPTLCLSLIYSIEIIKTLIGKLELNCRFDQLRFEESIGKVVNITKNILSAIYQKHWDLTKKVTDGYNVKTKKTDNDPVKLSHLKDSYLYPSNINVWMMSNNSSNEADTQASAQDALNPESEEPISSSQQSSSTLVQQNTQTINTDHLNGYRHLGIPSIDLDILMWGFRDLVANPDGLGYPERGYLDYFASASHPLMEPSYYYSMLNNDWLNINDVWGVISQAYRLWNERDLVPERHMASTMRIFIGWLIDNVVNHVSSNVGTVQRYRADFLNVGIIRARVYNRGRGYNIRWNLTTNTERVRNLNLLIQAIDLAIQMTIELADTESVDYYSTWENVNTDLRRLRASLSNEYNEIENIFVNNLQRTSLRVLGDNTIASLLRYIRAPGRL